jgi:hypothetical protein
MRRAAFDRSMDLSVGNSFADANNHGTHGKRECE